MSLTNYLLVSPFLNIQPTQEPTQDTFDSAAPSAAQDVDSVVPTLDTEDADAPSPTTVPVFGDEDDDPFDDPLPKDVSHLLSDDIEIADGALDGIMDPNDPLSKMGPILANVYNSHLGKASTSPLMSIPKSIIHDDGTVSVDAVAPGEGRLLQEMLNELEGIGFQVAATHRHVASGTLPIELLGEMCNCSTLVLAMPALAVSEKGSVTSEGVRAMEADDVVNNLDVNGAGIKIGILSDSFDGRGGAAADIASGDLPPANRMEILNDSATDRGVDEGRAMSTFQYVILSFMSVIQTKCFSH